jgi:hypothetical protein
VTRLLRLLAVLFIALCLIICTARVLLDLRQLDADARRGREEIPTMLRAGDEGTPGPARPGATDAVPVAPPAPTPPAITARRNHSVVNNVTRRFPTTVKSVQAGLFFLPFVI